MRGEAAGCRSVLVGPSDKLNVGRRSKIETLLRSGKIGVRVRVAQIPPCLSSCQNPEALGRFSISRYAVFRYTLVQYAVGFQAINRP